MTEAFGVGGLLPLGGVGLRMIRSEMRMNWLPEQSITAPPVAPMRTAPLPPPRAG